MKTKQPETFSQTSKSAKPRNTTNAIGVRDFWHFCKKAGKAGAWQGIAVHCSHDSCYFVKEKDGKGETILIQIKGAYANG